MNSVFEQAQASWHQQWLARADQRAQAGPASQPPGQLSDTRLRAAHLLLIANGPLGQLALASLQSLGLGRISVVPLLSRDAGPLKAALEALPAEGRPVLITRSFDKHGLAPALHGVDALAVALARPHPGLLLAVNQMAVRHGLPWCQVTLDGAELVLGPTVLPGVTACQACAEVRTLACVSNVDAWQAKKQFFDRNPGFDFAGRNEGLGRMAARLLAAEVERLIGGRKPLGAASRIVRYDMLMGPPLSSFVPYYEWCPVCRPAHGPETRSPGFEAFVRRRQDRPALQHSPMKEVA